MIDELIWKRDVDKALTTVGVQLSDKHTGVVAKCINAIRDMDVIDAEIVRHGMWEPVTVSSGRNSWRCSECGRHARGERKNLPYCHCGAKMDLEEDADG